MKKTKEAQVSLNKIDLVSISYEENSKFKFPNTQLTVVFEIGTKHRIIKEKLSCILDERVIVFPEIEQSPFCLTVEMRGIFSVKKEEQLNILEEFCKTNAPSIIFPYIRSIVSDITSRSSFPTLNLPLVDMSGDDLREK